MWIDTNGPWRKIPEEDVEALKGLRRTEPFALKKKPGLGNKDRASCVQRADDAGTLGDGFRHRPQFSNALEVSSGLRRDQPPR